MIEYASILLGYGNYALCIELCDCILSDRNVPALSPKEQLNTYFMQSRAYRDNGMYPQALETLRFALATTEEGGDCAYLRGFALLRIGKVYSEYLMMTRVSLHFFEEARTELSKWIEHTDSAIRSEARASYAICLDSIGQYWRSRAQYERENPEQDEERKQKTLQYYEEALKWYKEAELVNLELGRQEGILRNRAHMVLTQTKQLRLTEPSSTDKHLRLISEMQRIIRHLINDPKNEKGAGVRCAQLAEMCFSVGRTKEAQYALSQSREIALRIRDYKTLARAVTIALNNNSDWDLGDSIRELKARLDGLKYYRYQIMVNNLAAVAAKDGRLHGLSEIDYLLSNRAIYSELSEIAKETILTISDLSVPSVFSHLSPDVRFSLLRDIIGDYDWFIDRLNEIINKLMETISNNRAKRLHEANISVAQASAAQSVLHDFKHLIASKDSEENSKTKLNPVLEVLRSGTVITPEIRDDLIRQVADVNERINKILPLIDEATRVPRNLSERINVRDIFLNISALEPEEYQAIDEEVKVDCGEGIQTVYNIELFTTLFKELLRNAIDYQHNNHCKANCFFLKAEGCKNRKNSFIQFSVLTDFLKAGDAEIACANLNNVLHCSDKQYGHGLKLLFTFVEYKANSIESINGVHNGCQAGIVFQIPIDDFISEEKEYAQ